jgi:Peptidase C13 family
MRVENRDAGDQGNSIRCSILKRYRRYSKRCAMTDTSTGETDVTFVASLRSALRLYFFRPLERGAFAHAGGVFALAMLAIALWVGLDRYSHGEPVQFWVVGLVGIAWYVLAGIALAWLMAVRSVPFVALKMTAWIVAAMAPLLVAGFWFSSIAATDRRALWILLATLILVALYVARALKVVTGHRQTPALLLTIVASLLMGLCSDALYVNPSLWSSDPTDPVAEDLADQEGLLFDQSAKIDAAVAGLATPSGASAAAYMVGFAGVGEERVFAQEIGLAARVIGARYGTTHRTVLLVNDRRDRDTHPLATVSGLELTLQRLGERMDRERDVLFLVLSSHGSEEPELAVSNGSLPLNQLDGEVLAAALKESAIRWKVIVISACYAGGFIPPLQDDNTIILTAAAADRTSFGCGSDRDLTYFGEAFFRDALPSAPSLKAAFDSASAALAAREKAEQETPSHPQAYYGKAMTAKLLTLENATPPPIVVRH